MCIQVQKCMCGGYVGVNSGSSKGDMWELSVVAAKGEDKGVIALPKLYTYRSF